MLTPAQLLERHPKEAVRVIALDFLAQAEAARERLDDEKDDEALHDFRVAVRRLRSTERAFRDELAESVTKRRRKRMRRVAQATNDGRDAEVQLEWIDAQRASLYSRHRPGATWFRDRLRKQQKKANARLHAEVKRDFDGVAEKLRRALPCYSLPQRVGDAAPPPRFADALATRVRDAALELSLRLGEVTGPAAVDAAHQARIAAKRLRYLLEPVAAAVEGAKDIVRELKRVQDSLGELHDLDVVGEELADAIADVNDEIEKHHAAAPSPSDAAASAGDAPSADATGAEPRPTPIPATASPATIDRDPRPGLACLARRARTRREAVYGELAGTWFGGAAAPFLAALERVAQTLAAPHETPDDASAPSREIERKFLLRELPPHARDVAPDEIDQGWLPGDRLIERIRRVRAGDDERYYRTVKVGAGVSRIELEEETTRELFAALWPLTTTRRISKRRHKLADDSLVWEIDDFPALGLVVAEIELPDASVSPELPEWLEQYVVREVSEERGFTNYAMARDGVPNS